MCSRHISCMLADIQKAFLQISVREEDGDAFRFLFNVNGKEQHLRFTRVPFGVEASPFLLGATLQYHYEQQTYRARGNCRGSKRVHIRKLMNISNNVEELENFKRELASYIL